MKTNILSKYSQSPYTLIGLELTNYHTLTVLNNENFIMKQEKNEKIVLIISSYILNDDLIKLQNYSQVDAIYSYIKSDDLNEEFICIYNKKVKEGKYWEICIDLFEVFWFLVGLVVIVIFAYLFPHLGASNGPFHAEYSIKWGTVIIICLLSSLSVSTKNLFDDIPIYRLHLCIQIFNLIIIPCIVFGIALLLAKSPINKLLITGMILMSCMPTSIILNVSILTMNEPTFIERCN
jgi:SBF-like CPA transporter family (DUF4137)